MAGAEAMNGHFGAIGFKVYLHKGINPAFAADTDLGGGTMHTKEEKETSGACFRVEPEKQLCPIYDEVGIRTFRVAEPGEMGFRVVDDFVQEHIQ